MHTRVPDQCGFDNPWQSLITPAAGLSGSFSDLNIEHHASAMGSVGNPQQICEFSWLFLHFSITKCTLASDIPSNDFGFDCTHPHFDSRNDFFKVDWPFLLHQANISMLNQRKRTSTTAVKGTQQSVHKAQIFYVHWSFINRNVSTYNCIGSLYETGDQTWPAPQASDLARPPQALSLTMAQTAPYFVPSL